MNPYKNDAKLTDDDRLLSRKDAAEYLGVKEKTLAMWAYHGRYNLPMVKVGRLAKYRLSDLKSFIKERTATHS